MHGSIWPVTKTPIPYHYHLYLIPAYPCPHPYPSPIAIDTLSLKGHSQLLDRADLDTTFF